MNTIDTADFKVRWDNWVARGLVHEKRARRRFVIGAAAITAITAIAYLIVH